MYIEGCGDHTTGRRTAPSRADDHDACRNRAATWTEPPLRGRPGTAAPAARLLGSGVVILRDPVHGLVRFTAPHERIVVELLDTPEVQHLRRIRMLGLASLAFPGAEHSRFAHAVGAAHVMKRYIARMAELERALGNAATIAPEDAEAAMAAALLHDLGHGPLSHTFEALAGPAARHEHWTRRLLDRDGPVRAVLDRRGPGFAGRVVGLVFGRHPVAHLARSVSGTFDVDRLDYLLRDAYMTGTRYGLLDVDWLLQSLRLVPRPDGTGGDLAVDDEKGLSAVEGYFLARLSMYRQVYLHKAVRGAEMVLGGLVRRARALGDVPGPPALRAFLAGEPLSCEAYLSLDDGVLATAIAAWAEHDDPILADLSARFRDRRLFKSLPLADDADPEAARAAAAEVARAQGFDPTYYVAVDRVAVHVLEGAELPCVVRGAVRQDLLEASQLLRSLSQRPFVHHRIYMPETVRAAARERIPGVVGG